MLSAQFSHGLEGSTAYGHTNTVTSNHVHPLNRVKTVHLTLFTMGKYIHHFFYIFGYLLFLQKYMKNKIGILENDIYILPIVNSVIC